MKSPIAIFAFNRPTVLARTLTEVFAADPARVYFFLDGPRNGLEARQVKQCEDIFDAFPWKCEVFKIVRERNLGCGKAISTGLNLVFEREESAIILEDDCLPNSAFFRFVDNGLEHYRNFPEIFMISGFNELGVFNKTKNPGANLFGLGGTWGWGTWADRWGHYEYDAPWIDLEDFPDRMNLWERRGVSRGRIRELVGGAQSARSGEVDTWDYQWALCRLYHQGFSVLPPKNLVFNIGIGADATHGRPRGLPSSKNLDFYYFRNEVVLDSEYLRKVDRKRKYIRSLSGFFWLLDKLGGEPQPFATKVERGARK